MRKAGSRRIIRNNRFLFITLLISFVITSTLGYSQEALKVYASVDKKRMWIKDTLTLTITVETKKLRSIPDPDTSSLVQFNILNKTKSYSTSITIVNGKTTRIKKYIFRYTLKPRTTGELLIGPISITYRGKRYSSEPITVEVLKNKIDSKNKYMYDEELNVDQYRVEENVKIRVTATPKTLYTGQRSILTYELLSKYDIEKLTITENPSISKAYSVEIYSPGKLIYKNIRLNGATYKHAYLKKIAVFPLYPGKLNIEPMAARITVLLRNKNFPDLFAMPYSLDVETARINLNVKKLPEYRGTGSFSGIVGNLSASVSQREKTISLGKPAVFYITLKSSGNINNFKGFDLKCSPKCRIFLSNVYKDRIFKKDDAYFLKKFEYTMIPEKAGYYKIQPGNIVYFDTHVGEYRSIRLKNIRIKVVGETSGLTLDSQDNSKSTIDNKSKNPPYLKVLAPFVFASLIALFLILLLKNRRQNQDRRKKGKKEDVRETIRMLAAKVNENLFYRRIDEALFAFNRLIITAINKKLGVDRERILNKDLHRLDLSKQDIETLKSVFNSINKIKYSKKSDKTPEDIEEEVRTIEEDLRVSVGILEKLFNDLGT